MRHIGDGVVIVGKSGVSYRADRGEVVSMLPIDAEGLADHPEWEAYTEPTPDPTKVAESTRKESK
jgi:hypothetical protein